MKWLTALDYDSTDTMSLVICLTWFLLFCHEAESAVTAFGSLKPSNPTFVREWENITLKWNYTIDGSIGQAQFANATDDSLIAAKFGDGDVTVAAGYQERFRADISNTLAQLTILTVQRSDSGRYKFLLSSTKLVALSSDVELNVQYPAKITHISGNQTVNETDAVTLSCSAEGMPTPSITWTKVSDNSSVSFPLTITGKQHEGGYRCTAENGIGNPTSQDAYIFVERYHPIHTNLSTSLGKLSVLVNTSFNIICSAQANPPAHYRFYKDQDNVYNDTTGSDVSVFPTSVNKRIKQVNYSCTPLNDFGDGPTDELTLTVLYAPSSTNLITVPNNTTVLRGSIISLDCSTDANPDAHIYHFYLNESLIGNSSSGVFNTTVMADGVYTCVPVNTAGTGDNATVGITVVDPPSITINKIRELVEEGDNITLTCNVTGKPQPIISWTKLDSFEVLSNTSSLTIVNVSRPGTPDNMIQYQCTASNGVERPATATVNVTVHYAPSSTSLITVPNNTTLPRESNISLDCSTDANPNAHIYQFYLNGNLIGNSSSGVFNTTLIEDGEYSCVPINTVGTGEKDTISITVVYPPSIINNKIRETVEEGDNITLTCNASGKPQPSVSWTKFGSIVVLSNTSSLTIVNISRPGTPDNMIQYQCTASNGVGIPATDIAIVTVHYAPGGTTLTTIGSNTTVPHGNILSLNCQTDASPEAKYHFYFNGTSIGNSSSGMFNTSVMADGMYTCVPVNTVGTGDNATVSISVVVAPSVEILNETATVVEGEDFVLTCNASGKPKPSVTWTKVRSAEVLSDTSSLTIVNVSRPGTPDNMIEYQCTASNGVGTPATDTVIVTVHYHPLVTVEPKQMKVGAGKNATFECKASGNPKPIIVWRRGAKEVQKENVLHFITATSDDEGCYLCSAANEEGTSNGSVCLDVFDPEKEALEVNGRMKLTNESFKNELTNKSSESYQTLTSRVEIAIRGAFQSTYHFKEVYNATRVNKFENGSVVVFFTIIFNDVVHIDNAILVLVNASKNGTLGDLKVDPGSIKAFQPVTTTPATSSPKVTATTNATSDDDKDHDIDLWIIIGVSTGGAIVLVIIIVVVAWCVHHKRKCRRKGSKVCCSESEEQAFTPREDNDHGHVNNGYAEAGPRPTAMVNMSQHQGASVAPTYAVVDKSAKKGSMKDEKDEEKKPQTEPPQYSVVDKSKKKKKKKKKEEEPEATYAQVDMSKKSKKKAKPGEVLYADLGDFHQMQELPNVSTSPKALPPIKKPAPYVETQYADITQFLKGDVTLPDSNNSQGPAPGTQPAPVPENQESQEPGTSAKETSQASNPGGDGGPGHETNF